MAADERTAELIAHARNLRAQLAAKDEEIERLKEAVGDLRGRGDMWEDRYNREVLGFNNEGDPIGGDPPAGLRSQVERLTGEIERLREDLAFEQDWNLSREGTNGYEDRRRLGVERWRELLRLRKLIREAGDAGDCDCIAESVPCLGCRLRAALDKEQPRA